MFKVAADGIGERENVTRDGNREPAGKKMPRKSKKSRDYASTGQPAGRGNSQYISVEPQLQKNWFHEGILTPI